MLLFVPALEKQDNVNSSSYSLRYSVTLNCNYRR